VVSITLLQLTITLPLNAMAPLGSFTVPLAEIVMLLSTTAGAVLAGGEVVLVCAWVDGQPSTSITTTPIRSVTTIVLNSGRRVLMFGYVFM
jgi:hypothetical protein